jgi:hypothetical protein
MGSKIKIRHECRSHAGGAVATLVGVVALNALSVSRWVRGSTGLTLGCASRRISGAEAPHQESLVRVGTWSRVPCLLAYVGLVRRVGVGGVLT